MAILTESDLATYAPTVTLTGSALVGAIALIQNLIEAYVGRPLELTQFVEEKRVASVSRQTGQFSFLPIASSPAPVIEVRAGNMETPLGQVAPVSEWQTLASNVYRIDYTTGRLHLAATSVNTWRNASSNTSLSAPTYIRLTYTAGYNFSVAGADVNLIKSIAGAALTFSQQQIFSSGITELDVDNEYKVKYGAASGSTNITKLVGTIPASYLSALDKYKPRRWR